MFERLKYMLIKEFIQIFREPRMRAVIFLVPILQVMIFGYAVNSDVRMIPTAIFDQDHTPASRDLVSRFEGSGYFKTIQHLADEKDIQKCIDRSEVKAVLHIRRGFGEDLAGGRSAQAQIILDGSDSNTAGIVLGYASRIGAAANTQILHLRLARSMGIRMENEPVTLRWRAWFNPNLESRYFFVPGVIAQIVMIITIMLSAMAIVREREIGTMEQIMVTPIGRMEFILGKTLPFALIGFADVALISLVAIFWFEIPFQGSLGLLMLSTGLYLLSTLGVGLLISTVSSTQQQAMMSASFFAMPAILLSGFIYPIANMPESIQWITYLNPLRYFLVILRGIYLKGIGFSILWPQLLALLLLGSTLLLLAAARLKKTV